MVDSEGSQVERLDHALCLYLSVEGVFSYFAPSRTTVRFSRVAGVKDSFAGKTRQNDQSLR
jgi:hypothetical protein